MIILVFGYSFYLNPFDCTITFKYLNKKIGQILLSDEERVEFNNTKTVKSNPWIMVAGIRLYLYLENDIQNYINGIIPLITVGKDVIANPEKFDNGTYENYMKEMNDIFLINVSGSFRGYVDGHLYFSKDKFYLKKINEL